MTTSLQALVLALVASTVWSATLPKGCEMPTNTGNVSTRVSLETVCVRAACLDKTAKAAAAKRGDMPEHEDKVSEGGKMFEAMLSGKPTTGDPTTYMMGIFTTLMIPGLVFFLLNCQCGFCCCCARCCCAKKCGNCNFTPSSTRIYGVMFQMAPIVAYAVVATLIFVFAIVGMTDGSSKFANAFIRGSCTIDTVNVRVNGFIDSIIDPITDLNDEFGVIVDAVEEQLGSTQQIEDEMVNLETRFKQLESTSDNYKDWPNCDSLELISAAAGKASKATVASAKVFTDDLGAVTDSITENLLAAKGSISAATQSSQDSADDMKKVVADALTETSKQALSAANQISDHQGKISGGPFAWAFLVPAFATVGIALMKMNMEVVGTEKKLKGLGKMGSNSVVCAWSCTFFLAMISCLLAAIFMPVTQIYTDLCFAIDDFPIKMGGSTTPADSSSVSSTTPAASDDGQPDIISGCWEGQSIFDILGLADSMTFTKIDFGDSLDSTPTIGGKEYDEVGTQIKNIPENCGVRGSILDLWKRVDNSRADVETEIGVYQRNLKSIQTDQVGKLNELVNAIKNGGSCLFLKTTWDEIYEILCVDAKNGLSTLGTMSLLVGAFGFFSAFFLLWTQQTNGGHGPVQAGDDATKIAPEQQVEMQSVVATPVY